MSKDTWSDGVIASSPAKSSSNASPSRASRSKGLTNDVAHTSFTRDGSITFQLGDVVVIGPAAELRQKWLGTPEYQLAASPRKRGAAARKKRSDVDALSAAESWHSHDELKAGEKVGVIVKMYEDVKGDKMALMRWLARPSSVWGPRGPEDGEVVEDYELYYTSDSSFLDELRASSSWTPGSLSRSGPQRTPLCSDPVPISTITRHARVVPARSENDGEDTFVVKKVYDAKPVAGAEWFGEIEWEQVWKRGSKTGEWDVEAVIDDEEEGEEEEEESLVIDTPKKRKAKAKLVTTVQPAAKKRKSLKEESDSDDPSSEDDGDNDEATVFNPAAKKRSPSRAAGRAAVASDDDDDASDEDEDADDDVEDEEDTDQDEDGEESDVSSDEDDQYATPRKNRSRGTDGSVRTPTRRVRPKFTAATRSRQSAVARKTNQYRLKTAARSAAPNALPPAFLHSNPHLASLPPFKRAQALLHVSATPQFLPCREQQREQVAAVVAEGVLSGTGTCLYIHGVPGTGKTATVHSVVRELQDDPDMDPFTFVEINGMKIADPSAAFSLLWETLSGTGDKLPPKQALAALEAHFREPTPGRKTTVVLVDELDQMITKKQDVIYNFFNWPHVAHSRLIVIAVANTMDLPERELSGKIRSRLGSNRIVFTPYKWQELEQIMEARLGEELKTQIFAPRAIEHIAKKVAAGAGDARRALDIARRTVEKIEQFNESSGKPPKTCTISDASATYKEMTDYGSNAFLKGTSLQMRLFLLSLSHCVTKAGVGEAVLDDVMSHHVRFLVQSRLAPEPPQSALFTIVSSLHAQRLLATESQRMDYYQKVRPMIGNGELYELLRGDELLREYVPKE